MRMQADVTCGYVSGEAAVSHILTFDVLQDAAPEGHLLAACSLRLFDLFDSLKTLLLHMETPGQLKPSFMELCLTAVSGRLFIDWRINVCLHCFRGLRIVYLW